MDSNQLDRFESKYTPEPNTGCWLWTGLLKRDGYARFDSHRTAHRMSFLHWNGQIPEGKEIDHICRMRCCVNPAHLQAITHRENIAKSRGWEFNTKKTHCPKGHPYSGENLYMFGTNRQCNICRRARSLAFDRARKKKGVVS